MDPRYGGSRMSTVLHLVPKLAGDGDVSEWLDKLETTCILNDVTSEQDILYVITLRLTGEAYRVIQQLDTIANFNHSGIAVLLQDNISDGNTVHPYVKLHSEPGFDSWLNSSPLKLLHSGQCYQSRCCLVAKLRCQSG